MKRPPASGRCPETIEFCGMDLQCQRPNHGPGIMHHCEWNTGEGRHLVEWNSQLSNLRKGGDR